ncbi:MAG: S41 family peptidase [Marinifilaceae bacterium]|jgi:carboxyl-terminal processing protease|nr:S41 family peptidase [Marinifilaceae bacterium]
MKRVFKILKISIILSLIILLFTSTKRDERNFNISKGLTIYADLFREVNMFYVDDIKPTELIEKSIKNLLKELDPYTQYYNSKTKNELETLSTGKYAGIGCVIGKLDSVVAIMQVKENTPSQKAGVKAGDVILSVNDESVKGYSIKKVSKCLRGKSHTSIKLLLKRPGIAKPIIKEFRRENIQMPAIPYYGMIKGDIGYINFSKFTNKSANKMRTAILSLKRKGARGLVLDLRSNPGGLLYQAVNIANYFLSKGDTIVSTKGKFKAFNRALKAKKNPIAPRIPIVCLIGRHSASASEILAGSIQDYDRGVIIGQRSFGKGLVQTSRDLPYNAKLKITTAKYYTPSGRCVQALDYSHRNEDGSVGKVPDSLKTKFYTKNNRIVYDGGGIRPDIKTKLKRYSLLSESLIEKNIVFKFVNQYLINNNLTIDIKSFDSNDKIFSNFKDYLLKIKFKYNSDSETLLKQLEKYAKAEKSYTRISKEIAILKNKLSHSLSEDLLKNKQEVKRLLAMEFIQRSYFDRGIIQFSINNDSTVNVACKILKDKKKYNSILNK